MLYQGVVGVGWRIFLWSSSNIYELQISRFFSSHKVFSKGRKIVFSNSERKWCDIASVLTLFFFPSSLGSLELDTEKITVLWFICSPETQKQWDKVSETSCWWQCSIMWKKQKKKGKKKDIEWRWHKKITVIIESSVWLSFIYNNFQKISVTKRAKDILKNTEEFPLIVVHMDTNSTQVKGDVQARTGLDTW